jgi:hypothetical protein
LTGFAGPNFADIPTAAKRACCSSEEIVRAVLDCRLMRKARLAGMRGYMALLVDMDEVRALVRGADPGGFTGRMLAERLGVADRVSGKLIAGGHLTTVTVINPVNRCPMDVVPADQVERFEAEYLSLHGRQAGARCRRREAGNRAG